MQSGQEERMIRMMWGWYGMPFGMLIIPVLLFICIGIIFYSFNQRLNLYESQERGESVSNQDILRELRKLREEIEELKKEKNKQENTGC